MLLEGGRKLSTISRIEDEAQELEQEPGPDAKASPTRHRAEVIVFPRTTRTEQGPGRHKPQQVRFVPPLRVPDEGGVHAPRPGRPGGGGFSVTGPGPSPALRQKPGMGRRPVALSGGRPAAERGRGAGSGLCPFVIKARRWSARCTGAT